MEAPSEALLLVVTGEVNMKTFERKTCEKLNEVTKLMLMFSFYTDSLPADVKVHSGRVWEMIGQFVMKSWVTFLMVLHLKVGSLASTFKLTLNSLWSDVV